ncbi:methyltransferase domain-containing protein [Erythrobacter sp. LQ02-29]|uniref:methyltransferase n=1 Tax=Erythrobacter sp. LQ02-29 TaxID=2920384 RepID=UPI001F4DCE7F|nr:methyltransferase domain-containing protein [Erythrobacter sp. LQ02-29]
MRSQTLVAFLETGLFDVLADAPSSVARIGSCLDISPPAVARLLSLGEACGLIERHGELVALTTRGLVAAREPGVRAMIRHGTLLHADLVGWRAVLEGRGEGELARFWPYSGGPGRPEEYSQLMRESLSLVAEPLLDTVNFDRFETILELGGGDASLAVMIARNYSKPSIRVLDLPAVAPLADARIRAAGLIERVTFQARDNRAPQLASHDCVLMLRLLHDLDDGAAITLLRQAKESLAPAGIAIVGEPTRRAGRDAQSAYFTAYFGAMGSGRLRTRAQIEDLANQTGLTLVRNRRTGNSLLTVLEFGHH